MLLAVVCVLAVVNLVRVLGSGETVLPAPVVVVVTALALAAAIAVLVTARGR